MNNSAGLHLIMDARVKDASIFSATVLTELFNKIIIALDMKPLDNIKIYEVDVNPEILERVKATGNFEDEGGISTIQVISTSHITLHAWPLQNYFALDAFSCKDYDAQKALDIIRKTLSVSSENTLIVKRRKPEENSNTINVKYYEI